MRYAVYQLRKHPGHAHLHAVSVNAEPVRMIFDGKPKGQSWVAPEMQWVGNDLQPADVSTVFGPSALVVSQHAKDLLQQVWDAGAYEFLPIHCPGGDYFIVNVLEMVDCLRTDKSSLHTEPKKYQFIPHQFGTTVFKIPQDPTGAILIFEDSKDIEKSFTYLIELNELKGLRFDLLWEGNDKRQLTDKKAPPKAQLPELPIPQNVTAERINNSIEIRWEKIPEMQTYLIQHSYEYDRGYVTLTTVDCTNAPPIYLDPVVSKAANFYRVFSYKDNTRYRSKPSEVVRVD